MDVLSLLSEAQKAGLTVEAHNGDLRVRGPRTAAAVVERLREHKGELLAALAAGGAAAPVGEGLNGRDVQVWNQRPAVGPGLRDEQAVLHGNGQTWVTDLEDRSAGNVDAKRLERLPVQQLLDLGGVHTHSVHHDGAALQHADRETARFLRVAIPDGNGWHDPKSRAPLLPDAEQGPVAAWVPSHPLAGERPGWNPAAWLERLLYLAMRCERDRPDRAVELRQAVASMLTGHPALPENTETIGSILARSATWAKYFQKPA